MTKYRPWTALALVLALAFTLVVPPVSAAATPQLTYLPSGSSATLKLQNLSQESVYGVQLELSIPGSYTSATFTPSAAGAYAPPCHRVEVQEITQVTIYVTSQTPLNQGTDLALGTLALSGSFTMPGTAKAILLDRDLQPMEDIQTLTVARQSTGGGGGGSWGGGGGGGSSVKPVTYAVKALAAEHGSVSVSPAEAEAKATVTVTVKPERGYSLDTLTVTPVKGGKVDVTKESEERFTFTMPAAEVSVAATFRFTGYLTNATLPFADVAKDAWYYDTVCYVYDKGMMNGTAQDAFSPDLTTSRAMLVTILYRLTGQPETVAAGYPDVPAGRYYTDAVGWASQNRIVVGYESGLFQPDLPVTREQMATILFRYATAMGYNVTARGDVNAFSDAADIAPYAAEAMSWAVGTGLLTGMGDGTVAPGGQATRAQVATILTRFSKSVNNGQ